MLHSNHLALNTPSELGTVLEQRILLVPLAQQYYFWSFKLFVQNLPSNCCTAVCYINCTVIYCVLYHNNILCAISKLKERSKFFSPSLYFTVYLYHYLGLNNSPKLRA